MALPPWSRPLGGSVLLAALTGGVSACASFEAEEPVVRFELTGAHATLDCTACHGPEPFGPLETSCLACHEEDRKDEAHFVGRTCNEADGCHSAEHLAWDQALDHGFLPLEGAHAVSCEACHATPDGGDDLAGQAEYCWNCHEDGDRPDDGHYALEDDPLNLLYRWDCAPCHESEQLWTQPFPIFHKIRVPHGAIVWDGACVVGPEDAWVSACEDCHPDGTDTWVCLTCHDEAHEDAPNLRDEATCHESCHVSGGPDRVGDACDSLP